MVGGDGDMKPGCRPTGLDTASVGGSCQVRAECLAYAVEADEEFGIWGAEPR